MIPDVSRHDPRPDYLRALVAASGLSQAEAARRLGLSERMMRYYLAPDSDDHPAPYVVQFALEALAQLGETAVQPPRKGSPHARRR